MGYDNPLHGIKHTDARREQALNEAERPTDWATNVGRADAQMKAAASTPGPLLDAESQVTRLNPAQGARAMAVSLAASTLGSVKFSTATVSADQIIALASFIMGDPDVDFPQRWAVAETSGERMQRDEQALVEKVAKRRESLLQGLTGMFDMLAKMKPVDPSLLNVGDQIAPDGDVVAEPPAYNANRNVWLIRVQCPTREPGDLFEVEFKDGQDVPVFNRKD